MDCFHCGEACLEEHIVAEGKNFCCMGCKTVYEILSTNNLENYYSLNDKPGTKIDSTKNKYFDFLELPEFQEKYTQFANDKIVKLEYYIPQIHCNSCIWLLENLPKLNKDFLEVQVNFSSKKVQFTVNKSFSLKAVAVFLANLGYGPDFQTKEKESIKTSKALIYRIGVAGFCFGNIMLLAFPEYLGLKEGYSQFRDLFLWISFVLSIPVTFYSASSYLKNAYLGIKNRLFNMDLPIAIGLLVLFIRSTAELFHFTGQAYFDSLAGLIFFLLIGKWFQEKTFSSLSFDRDYKSFFPIAVQKIENNTKQIVKIEDLQVGDCVEIRNNELIPADAVLMQGEAKIDYSFVTGESKLEHAAKGVKVFAGGKQKGNSIQIQLIRKTNNSYLTGLWNSSHKFTEEKENRLTKISRLISKYFTIIILLLSIATAVYWYFADLSILWKSVTAVLIVACPCALALSIPFTYGNALKYLSKNKLYFRNNELIDKLTDITDIVFDKTGTLTNDDKQIASLTTQVADEVLIAIKQGTNNSLHPISRAIHKAIKVDKTVALDSFEEVVGKGIIFSVAGKQYKLGSAKFVNTAEEGNKVFVSLNNEVVARFEIYQKYREGVDEVLKELHQKYKVHVLSGDNANQKKYLNEHFKIESAFFNQSPEDKLNYIVNLKQQGKKVLMLGDGLNDAGALRESDIGIAISNSVHNFTPASDAILSGDAFHKLPAYLRFSAYCKKIVVLSFTISFLYNIIGLAIAVQGIFAPVLAAILMPVSSISVVLFTTLSIGIMAKIRLK